MKFVVPSIAALAVITSAASVNLSNRVSPLEVTLTPAGGSKVKAAITNTGSVGYNLLHGGSILDSAPVKKLTVSSACTYTNVPKTIGPARSRHRRQHASTSTARVDVNSSRQHQQRVPC